MKNFFKWIGCIVGFIFLLFLIIGLDDKYESKNGKNISNVSSSSHKFYTLNPNELAILNYLLEDEMTQFSKGHDSLIGRSIGITPVSAIEVSGNYEENQVAADQKYFKKTLFLTGKVASINSGLGNEPYVTLRGINSFMLPQVHFIDGNVEKIASLKRGQKINLVCYGDGAIIGTPVFKDCQFADEYASNKITQLKENIENFLSDGNAPSNLAMNILVLSIAIARRLPDTPNCMSNISNCLAQNKAIFKDDKLKQEVSNIIRELKLQGFEFMNL
jgi:hypothetical protein